MRAGPHLVALVLLLGIVSASPALRTAARSRQKLVTAESPFVLVDAPQLKGLAVFSAISGADGLALGAGGRGVWTVDAKTLKARELMSFEDAGTLVGDGSDTWILTNGGYPLRETKAQRVGGGRTWRVLSEVDIPCKDAQDGAVVFQGRLWINCFRKGGLFSYSRSGTTKHLPGLNGALVVAGKTLWLGQGHRIVALAGRLAGKAVQWPPESGIAAGSSDAIWGVGLADHGRTAVTRIDIHNGHVKRRFIPGAGYPLRVSVAAGDVWVTVYDPKLDHSALRRFRANPAISPLPEVGPSGTWSDLTVVGTPTVPGGWVIAQRGAHFLIYRMT